MTYVRLECSPGILTAVTELLKSRSIEPAPDSPFVLVERGKEIPETGIAIVFDACDLDGLRTFIDSLLSKAAKRADSGLLLAVKKDDSYRILRTRDIFYFQADGNSVYCRNISDQFEVPKKLYELETLLSDRGFFRIGKSAIVNILHVDRIIPWFGGRLQLRLNGRKEKLEVSRSYVRDFKKFLGLEGKP